MIMLWSFLVAYLILSYVIVGNLMLSGGSESPTVIEFFGRLGVWIAAPILLPIALIMALFDKRVK